MATTTIVRTLTRPASAGQIKLKVTVFHCVNALPETSSLEEQNLDFQVVKLPCSSMNREVHLLRAFEDGADAVLVLVCPEGHCRYMEGNVRAGKRVNRVKKILDEIGLDGRRLNIYTLAEPTQGAVQAIAARTLAELAELGPNPAS